jgi:hypothetical protein
MLKILVVVLLLIIIILMLGMRVFFTKNGKFPNTHVGGNEGMRRQGIGCNPSQDREAQKDAKRVSTADIVKQITDDKNNN